MAKIANYAYKKVVYRNNLSKDLFAILCEHRIYIMELFPTIKNIGHHSTFFVVIILKLLLLSELRTITDIFMPWRICYIIYVLAINCFRN